MSRILRIAAVLIVVLLASGAVVWFLAFRVGNDPPTRVSIPGLQGRALVTWHEGGDASVRLDDERDLARVTGALHVVSRPWLLLLIRQAALGRLSEWYGREALPPDHHVHRLGIPEAARMAFGRLSPGDQETLRAYAEGVNAALRSRRVQLAPAVAALDLKPEPWEAWHALAVERLIAWLSATVDAGPFAADDAVERFLASRDELGNLLGLGGLDHGAAWTMSDQPPGVFLRLVYGTSGTPPLLVLTIDAAGSQSHAVTWLGMPAAWAGRDAARSWVALPSGHAVVDTGTVVADPVYVPLRLRDGSRDVAMHTGDGRRIAIAGGHRVAWTGFAPVSDVDALVDLAAGRPADFDLVDGLAVITLHDRGAPPRTFGGRLEEVGTVTLVSSAPEAPELARSLALHHAYGPPGVFLDPGTAWADDAASAIERRLRSDPATTAIEGDALEFLAGWDGAFDGASIGAVIFDALPAGDDSTASFLAAMNRLRRRFGSAEQSWRWEREGGVLRYPGWIDASPYAEAVRLPDRYAPVEVERNGHPTAASWGSASPWVHPPAPAAFEAFIEDREDGTVLFRRPFVPYDRPLGRFSTSPGEREIRALPGRPYTGSRTELVPDS